MKFNLLLPVALTLVILGLASCQTPETNWESQFYQELKDSLRAQDFHLEDSLKKWEATLVERKYLVDGQASSYIELLNQLAQNELPKTSESLAVGSFQSTLLIDQTQWAISKRLLSTDSAGFGGCTMAVKQAAIGEAFSELPVLNTVTVANVLANHLDSTDFALPFWKSIFFSFVNNFPVVDPNTSQPLDQTK